MKIALIDPPGTSRGLNTGLAYIAANILAKRKGDSVKVFDFNNNRKRVKERIREIGEYDIISFSIKSFTQREAFFILDRILLRKESTVIFGGPHLAIEKEKFFEKDKRINAILTGEGETSFCNFLERLESKRNGYDIKGLAIRNEDTITSNGSMAIEDDLDSLPFPCYTVFDSVSKRIDNYPLLTSRGCPYKCVYCSVGLISGKRWRGRKLGSIIREIKLAREKFGFRYFFIIDDNFTFKKERTKEFCKALISEKIDLNWSLPNGIRADKVDEELVRLMKSSGCEAVSFGVESADPEVFKGIGKGETLDEISRAILLCKRYDLRVSAKFIIGLPGSSHESTKRSLLWAKKMKFYDINWNLLVPYPGTEAYEVIKRNGRFIRSWEDGFHFGPFLHSTFEIDSYSAREIEKDVRRANVSSSNL
ncbi:unnamed protein product, partial [marine sediment metagenome]